MFLAWTTVATMADADTLARAILAGNHAACVQIDGPILSLYPWNGKTERSEEFRLLIKCTEAQLSGLERCVLSQHPYETPEWIVVRADSVGEKYLSWAKATGTNPPL
jgi:periplasmic divalent cation tolerance protein